MSGRLNDVDLLGPPTACRWLPAEIWLAALAVVVVAAAVAVIVQVLV
jgi:hypothetical protein